MAFPLSISGEIPLPSSDPEGADTCDRIIEALETQGGSVTLNFGPDVTIAIPFYRGFRWKWDFVAAVDRVDLKISSTPIGSTVTYRLSLLRLTALGTLGVIAFAFTTYKQDLSTPFWLLPLMWTWLVGGNYVFTLLRARGFFRRAAAIPEVLPTTPASATDHRAKTTGFPPINRP